MYLQKVISKKLRNFFFAVFKVTDEKSRIRSQIRFRLLRRQCCRSGMLWSSEKYGFGIRKKLLPDPDPGVKSNGSGTYDWHTFPWFVWNSRGFLHRLNMELDLQSLVGLLCTHWLRPRNSPLPPAFWLIYEGAIGHWSAKIDDISL